MYWEAKDGVEGMKVVESELPLLTAEEVREQIRAARLYHMRVLFPEDTSAAQRERISELRGGVAELSQLLTFLLADDKETPNDEALAGAKARMAEDDTLATLIQAAIDLLGIAKEVRPRIKALKAYPLKNLDVLQDLVDELAEQGSKSPGRPANPDVEMRNRFLALAYRRVRRIRRAAAFVYRDRPDIARQARSAYERARSLKRASA